MNVLDYFKNLTSSEKPLDFDNPEIEKGYSILAMNTMLANYEIYLPIIAKLNKLNLTPKAHYTYLFYILPKREVKYQSKKVMPDPERENLISLIKKHYKCNLTDANGILDMMDNDDKIMFLEKFRYGREK